MPGVGPDDISKWTPTILTKFIRDLLNNNPPDFLPNLNAENITSTATLRIKDKLEYTKEPRFRKIGGTGQPPFLNSWVNYDAVPGWQNAGFYKDPLGFVHLRGLIKNGTLATSAFTLPPGHRPIAGSEIFACLSGNTGDFLARVDVQSSGDVVPRGPGNQYISLSGITFRTS
jgi:hypothetical protein